MVQFQQLTNTTTTEEALGTIDALYLTAMVCLNDDVIGNQGDAVDKMLESWYGAHWPTPSIWEKS